MRLEESIGYQRTLKRRYRNKFFELWNPALVRFFLVTVGLLAFFRLLGHAVVRVIAIAFLILWAELCDAQLYELFGKLHRVEYWYYARLLEGVALILVIDAFICLGQAMNSLWWWMELRELKSDEKKSKRIVLKT